MNLYQSSVSTEKKFNTDDLSTVSSYLKTKGQSAGGLDKSHKESLNSFFRSDIGREFVASLDKKQLDIKWENVGKPLSEIKWIQDLSKTDPDKTVEILARTNKLYNQNPRFGRGLVNHLQNQETDPSKFTDWIDTNHSQYGVGTTALNSIQKGQNGVGNGIDLFNTLENSKGLLGDIWKEEIYEQGNFSLVTGGPNDIALKLFDKSMRDPVNGMKIVNLLDSDEQHIGKINMLATSETIGVSVIDGAISIKENNGQTHDFNDWIEKYTPDSYRALSKYEQEITSKLDHISELNDQYNDYDRDSAGIGKVAIANNIHEEQVAIAQLEIDKNNYIDERLSEKQAELSVINKELTYLKNDNPITAIDESTLNQGIPTRIPELEAQQTALNKEINELTVRKDSMIEQQLVENRAKIAENNQSLEDYSAKNIDPLQNIKDTLADTANTSDESTNADNTSAYQGVDYALSVQNVPLFPAETTAFFHNEQPLVCPKAIL